MSVYFHSAMSMPSFGQNISSKDRFWDWGEEDFYGDGDEDDFGTAPMLYCAYQTESNPPGTYMISATQADERWMDAIVSKLDPLVLQKLPRDRVWWRVFSRMLQCAQDDNFVDNARMAYVLEYKTSDIEDMLGCYKDLVGCFSEAFTSVGAAKHHAVVTHMKENNMSLKDGDCENEDEYFDVYLDATHKIYAFAGQYVIIVEDEE